MGNQPPEFPGPSAPPPPPEPAQWPQGPTPQHGYPMRPPTNGMAVASMVLGIVGLFLFPLFMIPNILAVIFGFVALNQIKRVPPNTIGGRGMAIAGLVMGFVGIALFLLLIPFGTFEFRFGNLD